MNALFEGLSATFEMVDPDMARDWLAHLAPHQRSLSSVHVRQLAKVMAAGGWRVAPATIAFDRNGELVDGQHRLFAVVQSKVTVPLIVIRGIDPSTFDVIDQNRPRRPSDLWPGGVHEGRYLQTIARFSLARESGRGLYNASTFLNTDKASTREVLARMHGRKDMFLQVLRQAARAQNVFKHKAILAFLLIDFAAYDASKADVFITALASGAMLGERSPIKALRDRLLVARQTTDRSKELSRLDHAVLAIKTWNMFALGVRASQLRAGLLSGETFPQPVGVAVPPSPRVQKSAAIRPEGRP